MATIDLSSGIGDSAHPSAWANVKTPYFVETEIDFAAAVTAKGSALAQADVIQALDIPAGTVILMGGVQVTEAMAGTSTDTTLDVGITGGDVDNLVDGFDFDGASLSDYAVTGVNEPVVVSADDTIDILIATQTGTITGGKLRVFALLVDIVEKNAPGLAALGS